jgi:hypothetical protein
VIYAREPPARYEADASVALFLDERCLRVCKGCVGFVRLYDAYCRWARERAEVAPLTRRQYARALVDRRSHTA